MDNHIQIVLLTSESIPYELLLQADPSKTQIENYLKVSSVYLAKHFGHDVGVLVLKTEGEIAEIMNVSVQESYQGKGIGSKLIQHAIQLSQEAGIKKLQIGTADTSSDQLRLYQKLGFSITERIKNFFIEHYPKPIYENGKQAKDMIRLEMSLS